MGETVEFDTASGTRQGYLALPPTGTAPGLVVIQDRWGLVDQIRGVCDRFAAEGFGALAPDLFEGEAAEEPDAESRLAQELEMAGAAHDAAGGVRYLLDREEVVGDRVGVVGFCLGGGLALVTAATVPEQVGAVDSYYGVFWYGEPELAAVEVPVVLRVGTDDELVSVETVEALAAHLRSVSGVRVDVKTYPGAGHGFFDDTRPDAYAPACAQRAWQDTLAFLRDHLG